MTLNEYFTKILIISLARRPDRWAHAEEQCRQHRIEASRFDAVDAGPDFGNDGCTASHRAVLDTIVLNQWPRTLIFEDDFEARFTDVQEKFSSMIGHVPDDWFMLYLGGHYAERPKARVHANVIRINHMKTTSSYAVTLEAAREMAPFIKGTGPIDELYRDFNIEKPCYIFQPRLFVQYGNFSDLQKHEMDNSGCMTDSSHENMV